MEKTITRRKFIAYCGMSAAALAAYTTLPSIFTGCSSGFSQDKFIQLSAFLTGFDQASGVFDEKYAEIYLKSLEKYPPSKTTMQELFDTLGVDTVGNVNVQLTDDQQKLANEIITCWYTGNYTADNDELKSATYEDMLAWKATGYVTPNAQCHGVTGFWATAPEGVSA
ncbi:MAG: twin-arginine translocation signal domain-containing protein [Ignavibacteriae bacterium]|nr:twin-arginine translocation signal domain-containing protein [Ignavibacteriota bacterium]MCB9244619.1 twin-arginine translocation signal domain-containing protein [Ignavibacteriales bacterium]